MMFWAVKAESMVRARRVISLLRAGVPSCLGPNQFQWPSGSLTGAR